MKEFTSRLNISNKDNFPSYHYERTLCYMRRDIFEHIIRESEDSYFELDKFYHEHKIKDNTTMENMTSKIIEELQELGWKCKTSFGGTGLFIYSTENPPPNCYDDTF